MTNYAPFQIEDLERLNSSLRPNHLFFMFSVHKVTQWAIIKNTCDWYLEDHMQYKFSSIVLFP